MNDLEDLLRKKSKVKIVDGIEYFDIPKIFGISLLFTELVAGNNREGRRILFEIHLGEHKRYFEVGDGCTFIFDERGFRIIRSGKILNIFVSVDGFRYEISFRKCPNGKIKGFVSQSERLFVETLRKEIKKEIFRLRTEKKNYKWSEVALHFYSILRNIQEINKEIIRRGKIIQSETFLLEKTICDLSTSDQTSYNYPQFLIRNILLEETLRIGRMKREIV